jgi:hypothetical protein
MAELRFAHEEIDGAGQGIQEAASNAHSDLAAFQAELAGHGEPWGKELNDPIGPLIGACYTAISSVAMECYARNISTLRSHGDATRATAATYRAGEAANVSSVNRVREVLG